jgi:hypothetical protein
VPNLPLTLHPADTLRLGICFHPHDTGMIEEAIILRTPCDAFYRYKLIGVGAAGILQADDITFDPIAVGATECRTVVLRNVGTQVLHILRGDLSDTTNFSVDSATTTWRYPMPIVPGSSISATLCYHPNSTDAHEATMNWRTDVSADALALCKQSSILSAGAASSVATPHSSRSLGTLSAWIEQGRLTVSTDDDAGLRGRIVLFDILGRQLAAWDVDRGESRVVESIPGLPAGEYVVRLTDGGVARSCLVRSF